MTKKSDLCPTAETRGGGLPVRPDTPPPSRPPPPRRGGWCLELNCRPPPPVAQEGVAVPPPPVWGCLLGRPWPTARAVAVSARGPAAPGGGVLGPIREPRRDPLHRRLAGVVPVRDPPGGGAPQSGSSVWTRRRAVRQGQSGGSGGTPSQREREGVRGRWAPPPAEGEGLRRGQGHGVRGQQAPPAADRNPSRRHANRAVLKDPLSFFCSISLRTALESIFPQA